MPGHSNAALASYGFLNPDGKRKPLYTGTEIGFSSFMTHSEETYKFLDKVDMDKTNPEVMGDIWKIISEDIKNENSYK